MLLAAHGSARAQDDGARLYMMVPDKTTIASLRLHRLHSNLAVDPGAVAGPDSLDTNLAVFQFVQALNFGGRQSFLFLVVPASRISTGDDIVAGLGDAQLGFVFGLHGTPALAASDYGRHRPGLAVNAMAKLFFPTGAYSSGRPVNVGANRWALRLGAPLVYAIGEGMADPGLVTVELMPTVTFFGANDDPFEAGRTRQKPLFIFEGHLTRGFARSVWASLDILWREGGELEVDGVGADNPQRGLSLGGTATFALGSGASLRVSGGGVVARNAHGPNGWMLRTIVGVAF
ncbi:MAG TPA: transporter [Allosphingosinicella sp.]|nr:transporter [Allosphingosinicella sp.]